MEYFLKGLKINEAVLGVKHVSTATSYGNIGSVYYDKGDYNLALQYLLKGLKIQEDVLGV